MNRIVNSFLKRFSDTFLGVGVLQSAVRICTEEEICKIPDL